ncbi:MAG: hypothetical protein H7Z40_16145, partial [Phycisphaerae bacterium]|nr:hypothetical protein [Gemmatimonadaceae bacterium]
MIAVNATLGIAALVGVASGADAAIWGMYKDAAHEGFFWPRFFRSILLGSAAAVAIQAMLSLNLPDAGSILLLFGLAYAVERVLVEGWKTFVRNEDQSKYAIPMQFAVKGVPVRSRSARLLAGAGTLLAIAVATSFIYRMSGNFGTMLHAAIAGLVAGLIIAVGGAWKDAPIEGFEYLKFWRSPALTVLFAVLLFPLTGNAMLAGIAAIGYERAASENYKTFFFPSRPRGKFAGKPVAFPSMLRVRHRFVPAYALIRLGMVWLVADLAIPEKTCAAPSC